MEISDLLPSGVGDSDLLIVVSQDCDVLHESYGKEPLVELIVARRIPDASENGSYHRAKNPRQLQFRSSEGSLHECKVNDRIRVDRSLLTRHSPDDFRRLDEVTSKIIPVWIGKRYTRTALPDAFNSRVRPRVDAIRKLLRADPDAIDAIFLTLVPEDEVEDGESYRALMSIVVTQERLDDTESALRLEQLAGDLASELNKCAGIEVEDFSVVSDEMFSLADMKRSQVWDIWDDLSYASND